MGFAVVYIAFSSCVTVETFKFFKWLKFEILFNPLKSKDFMFLFLTRFLLIDNSDKSVQASAGEK